MNGRVFNSAEELAQQIGETLAGFDSQQTTRELRKWRENLVPFKNKDNSWEFQWQSVMVDKVLYN